MWWSRKRTTAALLCLLTLALASCGFRPLYGTNSYNVAVLDDLASVEVVPLGDRGGQLIHNALLTDLNPRGEAIRPRYRLQVSPSLSESQQALRTDDTATRNLMTYSVSYWLYEGNTRVLVGSFVQMFSYVFLEEHYANISAADDIHHRAAQSIADEIRNRLAAYFAKSAEVKAQSANK
jgi:LPS-assembly lipoprotein